MSEEKKIGEIVHFYTNIQVAVVKLTDDGLAAGDRIHIKGATTDAVLAVESLQVNHETVEKASQGQEVAVKVGEKARAGDEIFRAAE